ncbi:MAG: DoxX family protein [Nitrosopumilus sp.]|nr:DoxX family protein [Nitrosopumilus sp.]
MQTAEIRESIFGSVAMAGIRSTLGFIFILHGLPKFDNPGFAGYLESISIPAAMQYPIALGEFVPGVMLVLGVLSRMSAGIIAAIMLGAMLFAHGLAAGTATLTGDDGVEFHLILIGTALMLVVTGPGRLSIAGLIRRLPRWAS